MVQFCTEWWSHNLQDAQVDTSTSEASDRSSAPCGRNNGPSSGHPGCNSTLSQAATTCNPVQDKKQMSFQTYTYPLNLVSKPFVILRRIGTFYTTLKHHLQVFKPFSGDVNRRLTHKWQFWEHSIKSAIKILYDSMKFCCESWYVLCLPKFLLASTCLMSWVFSLACSYKSWISSVIFFIVYL